MPLCKFYKERYTDDTDLLTLYSILGVKDFDEWQDLFIKYIRYSKSLYPQGNIALKDPEIMPQFVKKRPLCVKICMNICLFNFFDYFCTMKILKNIFKAVFYILSTTIMLIVLVWILHFIFDNFYLS